MSNLVILFIHFIATLARLLGPGGVRSIVAESLIVKHQLLIVNRSTDRLGVSDPNRQRRGPQDSRPALPAGTGLWWFFLADFPGPHERLVHNLGINSLIAARNDSGRRSGRSSSPVWQYLKEESRIAWGWESFENVTS